VENDSAKNFIDKNLLKVRSMGNTKVGEEGTGIISFILKRCLFP